jgi:hypothetical protein
LTAAISSPFTVNPGPVSPAQSTVTPSPASVTADGSTTSTITVTLMDANNNPVPGKTVTLGMTSGFGSPTISAASGPSSSSGVVTFTVKSTTAGADVFTATDTTDSNLQITQTATVTFTAGAAVQLAVTQEPSATATAGTAFATQPKVTAQDLYGNTVTTYVTAITAIETAPGGGGPYLNASTTPQTATPSNGVATFTGLYVTNASSFVTLGFNSGSLIAATSTGINVSAAAATQLVYTSVPTNGTAGTPFSVTVQSQDGYGNPSSPTNSTTITLSNATGGGTLSGTLTGTIGTNANSETNSAVVYSYAGTMTLTATATAGMTNLTAASGNIVFAPGGPPVANAATYSRARDTDIQISVTNLLALYTSDAYGDPVGLVSVAGGLLTNYSQIAITTNGTVVFYYTDSLGSSYIFLGPTNDVNESFAYVVDDTNYPALTATNYITITVTNAVGQETGQISTTNGTVVIVWAGIPGTTNVTQRATEVQGPWTNMWTNVVPTAGVFTNIDSSPPQPSAYYRLEQY